MEATAISTRDWSRGVRRDPEAVRRGAMATAWALADDEAFAAGAYQGSNEDLAGLAGLAPNTVKNSLLQLRALGHVAWRWERIDGVDVRTLRPAIRSCAPETVPVEEGEPVEAPAAHVEAEPMPVPSVAPVEPTAIIVPDAQSDAASASAKRARPRSKRAREAERFERVQEFAAALPWPPRCQHDDCGARADILCADEGMALCLSHRRHAAEPFSFRHLFSPGRR